MIEERPRDFDAAAWVDVVAGERVKTLRLAARMTQQQVAERVRLTRSSIANIEAGRQPMTLRLVVLLADALAVPLGEIFPPSYVTADHPSRWSSFEDYAQWLESEARRIKAAREAGHGGTTHRYDLVHFADGIQWAARHARDRAREAGE